MCWLFGMAVFNARLHLSDTTHHLFSVIYYIIKSWLKHYKSSTVLDKDYNEEAACNVSWSRSMSWSGGLLGIVSMGTNLSLHDDVMTSKLFLDYPFMGIFKEDAVM